MQARLPADAAPAMTPTEFISFDGTHLPYRAWLPDGPPGAVIVALHGFNDYSHAFELPGEYMRLAGVATYAYDQRGFGQNAQAGLWGGKDNLIRDADSVINAVKARYPSTPVFVLGESMGGAVAIAAASRPDFPAIDGLIVSAPAIWGGPSMNPFFRMTLWTFAHIAPTKKLTGQDLHILASDNIDMLRGLGEDPYVIKATRIDAIYGLVRIMDAGYEDIARVRAPMLVLYGAHDEVIPPAPVAACLRKAPPGTQAAYYPVGYHMLMRDLHGDVPVRDILSWMADRHRKLPSGYAMDLARFAHHAGDQIKPSVPSQYHLRQGLFGN